MNREIRFVMSSGMSVSSFVIAGRGLRPIPCTDSSTAALTQPEYVLRPWPDVVCMDYAETALAPGRPPAPVSSNTLASGLKPLAMS
jgi:hypothetical protein